MSNKKDLSIVPKALEGIVVADAGLGLMASKNIVDTAIQNIKTGLKRNFYESINIGYNLQLIKDKSETGFVSENYQKAGLTDRTAQNYIKVYKAFRELDSKKALNAFANLEQSKLYELARLSKANLNQLAKEPELIKTIESQTKQEFKQQLLPGLISGDFEEINIIKGEIDVLNDKIRSKDLELERKNAALKEYEDCENFASAALRQAETKNEVVTNTAIDDIEVLTKQLISLRDGKHAHAMDADSLHVDNVKTIIIRNADSILARAQRLAQLAHESFTPSEIVDGELSEGELERVEMEFDQRRSDKMMQRNDKGVE